MAAVMIQSYGIIELDARVISDLLLMIGMYIVRLGGGHSNSDGNLEV
jgi:hypothetical protein